MIAALVALVLIVLVCIFAASASSIRNEYAAARNGVGEELYRNLHLFASSFEGVALVGSDVEGTILPAMQDYFVAARALDAAITQAYGVRYTVLTGGVDTAIAAAFDAYDEAFRTGKSPDDATRSMGACVDAVKQILLTRFDNDYRLQGT